MIKLIKNGVYLINGNEIVNENDISNSKEIISKDIAKKGTMSYGILQSHNVSEDKENLNIKFDAMASHDITYVGIVQTARASGLKNFPIPYVLTNCHNSLCAVGGTINEDDHVFGLSAAKKYGGIYVPGHQAVIHQYMREEMAHPGKMILGSDSHTRYGALGTMAMGEGGPELVKQLLSKTYDIVYPNIVMIYLKGNIRKGVGPQDVVLSIIKEVFKNGFVKNKVMEFVGPGIKNLPIEYRNGIDVMTTETTCLSSVWQTDDKVNEYFIKHGRKAVSNDLKPSDVAYYDSAVIVDLDTIEPVIALPFHPSNVYTLKELLESPKKILQKVEDSARKLFPSLNLKGALTSKVKDGKIMVDQAIIAGCSGGTYDNIVIAANMMDGKSIGNDNFTFSVYPASQPVFMKLNKENFINKLMASGATVKTAFCGPCFGAGDTPSNNAFSIRHTTRNFPNREGSKPGDNQISWVSLMDARSIAATAANKGVLTSAFDIDFDDSVLEYEFEKSVYKNRVYNGYGKPDDSIKLQYGPNIKDWPEFNKLSKNIIFKVVSYIDDEITTTDELIPSGETSSYRSNPLRLAEFTLSRKDPLYVGKSKEVHKLELERFESNTITNSEILVFAEDDIEAWTKDTSIGSLIYANKPGDGSAREQAASCQKVLGGIGNICIEYATKRYRSNVINWGMLPFTISESNKKYIKLDSYIYVEGIADAINNGKESVIAYTIIDGNKVSFELRLDNLDSNSREIIDCGCLINYYRVNN